MKLGSRDIFKNQKKGAGEANPTGLSAAKIPLETTILSFGLLSPLAVAVQATS